MNFGDIKRIHFVGIGGIGMSGMAEILAASGLSVSGCDARGSAVLELLARRGVEVFVGHSPDHLSGMDAVVVTAAVKGKNSEVDAAQAQGLRVFRRAEMLGAIVNQKRAVGVAGTHGKTTTSAMISVLLEDAGLDPTMIVGGMVRNIGTNAKVGQGEFLVVEADEYDRTFHQLHPEVAVVTNIEADHLEYYGSFEAILEAFRIYLSGVRRGGTVIGCVDDPEVARVLDAAESGLTERAVKVVRYGLGEKAVLRATRLRFTERGTSFDIEGIGSFKLFVPGEHNIRNALAAIATARALGVDYDTTARGLARFLGVDRRFQVLGEVGGALIVDDYAHHPTEIRATLTAARSGYPSRRVVALFQPHLYSRTRDFAREFAESLLLADVALLAPIYAAREKPLEGITSRLIADEGKGIELLEGSNAELAAQIGSRLRADDIFIAMGAGDVHEVAEALIAGEAA